MCIAAGVLSMESRGKLCMKIQVWETKKSFSIFSMLYICSIIFLLFTDSSGFLRLFLGRWAILCFLGFFWRELFIMPSRCWQILANSKFRRQNMHPSWSYEYWNLRYEIKVGGNEKKVLCSFVIIVFLWIFLACFRLFRIV